MSTEKKDDVWVSQSEPKKSTKKDWRDMMPDPDHIREFGKTKAEREKVEDDLLHGEMDEDERLELELSKTIPDWDILDWEEQQELIQNVKSQKAEMAEAQKTKTVAEEKATYETAKAAYQEGLAAIRARKEKEGHEKSMYHPKPTPDDDPDVRLKWLLSRGELIGEFTPSDAVEIFKSTGRVVPSLPRSEIRNLTVEEARTLRLVNDRSYENWLRAGGKIIGSGEAPYLKGK